MGFFGHLPSRKAAEARGGADTDATDIRKRLFALPLTYPLPGSGPVWGMDK